MELILFIGIPASGKSSFYSTRFFNSHVRISMDLLNTRNKEQAFFDLGLKWQQRMVIDNTNVTQEERAGYIKRAKAKGYRVFGYFFQSRIKDCLERNRNREEANRIDERGVLAKHRQMELPTTDEGFDALWYVEMSDQQFEVSPWNNEI